MKRKHWKPGQTGPKTREDRIARVLEEDRDLLDFSLSQSRIDEQDEFSREFARQLRTDEFGITDDEYKNWREEQEKLMRAGRPEGITDNMPKHEVFDPKALEYLARLGDLGVHLLVTAAKTVGHRATVTDITSHDAPIPKEVIHYTQDPPMTA